MDVAVRLALTIFSVTLICKFYCFDWKISASTPLHFHSNKKQLVDVLIVFLLIALRALAYGARWQRSLKVPERTVSPTTTALLTWYLMCEQRSSLCRSRCFLSQLECELIPIKVAPVCCRWVIWVNIYAEEHRKEPSKATSHLVRQKPGLKTFLFPNLGLSCVELGFNRCEGMKLKWFLALICAVKTS